MIQANNWFQPFATLREFIETKCGVGYRKGMAWIEIYNALANSGIPWAKVKNVGWTKLWVLARVLTLDNVDQWVAIASQQNTVSLIETVKATLDKKPEAITDETSKTVTVLSYKVHADQLVTINSAVDKAKADSGTQNGDSRPG